MKKNLYFARYDYQGKTIWAGHFLAYDAALARLEASEAFERDRATSKAHSLPLGPMACECTLTVKRSKSNRANAINA
jgi:hypothetical protein